jgi:hypothetical protein
MQRNAIVTKIKQCKIVDINATTHTRKSIISIKSEIIRITSVIDSQNK